MRRRSNLLVLLGIAFFVVGGVIVYLLTDDDGDDGGGQAAPPKITVVVPTDDIEAGALADELLAEDRLTTAEVTAADVVPGAVQSIHQLSGATFIQGFAADQQIISSGVQMQNRTFEVPEGFEAVAVQLDFVPGGAGYVSAGDRINVYGAYGPELLMGEGRPTPRAELLLTNVEVLDVDVTIPPQRGSTTDVGNTPRASSSSVTYLLALRTADAEKVVFTTEFARLYASLPAADAPPAGPTPGRDGGSALADEPNVAFNG